MVEVGPGVVVTAEEANFIFERLHRIKEGEMEVLGIRAPSSMKINDLCTLSRLLLNKDFEEAKELVVLSPTKVVIGRSMDSVATDNNWNRAVEPELYHKEAKMMHTLSS